MSGKGTPVGWRMPTMLIVMGLLCGLFGGAVLGHFAAGSARTNHAHLTSATSDGGQYEAITPVRIIDTRSGTAYFPEDAPLQSQQSWTVSLANDGIPGLPSSGLLAVNLQVTVVPSASASGYLTAWPSDQNMPGTALVDYTAGQVAGNMGMIQVSASSESLTFYASSGPVNLVVDLNGYVTTDSSQEAGGASYVPLTEQRIINTLNGTGGYEGTIGSSPQAFTIAGVDGVPLSGVSAVVLDVAAVTPSTSGYIQVWAAGTPNPGTTAVNYTSGQTSEQTVTVELGSNGQIDISSDVAIDVIADLYGYYTTSGNGSVFVPLPQTRLLDTRSSGGNVAANSTTPLTVTGTSLVQAGAPPVVPTGATAVLVDIDSVQTSQSGYIDAYPAGTSNPGTATLLTVAGVIESNEAIVQVGTSGQIDLFSSTSTSIVVDLYGYFQVPSGPIAPNETRGGSNPSELAVSQPSTAFGDPGTGASVDDATGELDVAVTDDQIPGYGLSLDLTRTYGSSGASTLGPFGYGWAASYTMSVAPDPQLSGVEDVVQENGSVLRFTENGAGQWVPTSQVNATLVYNSPTSGQWTFVRDGQDRYVFNSSGQLITETDPAGESTSLFYSSNGELAYVADPEDRELTFGWGSCGAASCVTAVTDPAGRTIRYAYDSSGDLSGVEDVGGAWTYYGYNTSNHLLTSITDADGNRSTITYGSGGLVAGETDPLGHVTSWSESLSSGSGTTTITDPLGYQTLDDFTSGGLTSETRAYGTSSAVTTAYVYDPVSDGWATKTVGAGTNSTEVTTKTYNDSDTGSPTEANTATSDVIAETTGAGSAVSDTETMAYNTANQPLTETDSVTQGSSQSIDCTATSYEPNDVEPATAELYSGTCSSGTEVNTTSSSYSLSQPEALTSQTATVPSDGSQSTTYTYDSYGDVLTASDPMGNETTYGYNNLGEKTSMVSPRGNASGQQASFTTSYTYDAYGHLTSTTTPTGSVTSATDDPYGKVLTSTDADGNVTTNTYNGDQELIKAVAPNGAVTTYSYNADGEKTSETDGNGNTTSYTYDPLGDELSETQPGGQTTSYTYDSFANKLTETDPEGNETRYAYDANNQLIDEYEPNGTTISHSYNGAGQETSYSDGAGNTTQYQYNNLGQLTEVIAPSGSNSGQSTVTSYSYDGYGNKLSETQPSGQPGNSQAGVSINWAYNADNKATSVSTNDNGATPTVSYTYDPDGDLTTMSDGSGTTSYTYNDSDQLTGYENGAGATAGYGYDPYGNVTSITYPNGSVASDTYTKAEQLASVSYGGNTTSFSYDDDGNQTSIAYPDGITESEGYNSDDELTSITDASSAGTSLSFSYTPNADGLISSETDTGTPDPGSTNYSYTPINELESAGSTDYAYSSAQDLTTDGNTTQSFAPDDEECWSATSSGSSCASPPSGATTYAYNANGDQLSSTTSGAITSYSWNQNDELTGYSSTASASYVYDGAGLLEDETSGSTTTKYLWDTQASTPLILFDGTNYYVYGSGNTPIEQVNASTGTDEYLLADQLGSTRGIAGSSGTLVGTFTYNAWGGVVGSSGSATTPFMFAGQYQDPVSGLYYMRARWYDATTGQFMSLDPALQSTDQPYQYAGDDPVNETDPSGQRWFGKNCVTKSSARGYRGQFCIMVNQSDLTGGMQALVTFTSYTGAMSHISVLDAVINFDGGAQQWTDARGYPPNNSPNSGYISTGWSFHVYGLWWADVEDPYIGWPNGQAISRPGWLESGHVYAAG